MNRFLYILALTVFTLVYLAPSPVLTFGQNAPDDWSEVAPGFQYRKYHLSSPRPIDIFVTRMDRTNVTATVDSSIAQGRLSGGVETVLGMAGRYDQAINYWDETWGGRNRVVAAINGYFFGAPQEPSGIPWSGQIHSGWYAKRYTTTVGDAGFVWTLDRQADIGSCVSHRDIKNYVKFIRANYERGFNKINSYRDDEAAILYTPQFDQTTLTASSSNILEILIELSRPSLVLPAPGQVLGVIRDIRNRQGSTDIPFDHVVLSAWDDARDTILSRIDDGLIEVGDQVGITQEITNCAVAPQVDWTKSYAGIGGDYHFLNDGVVRTSFNNPDAGVPNSRTAVGYNGNYVFFVVVDGFNSRVSEGMSIPELGNFIKNTLGGTDAVSQDSGGSSTMVVNGQVVNNTTCNFTRDCGIITPPEVAAQERTHDLPTVNEDVQPLVGNGLLMVSVQPRVQSASFIVGQQVTTRITTSLRLGPGTNYGTITTVSAGLQGVIADSPITLQGVLAKGLYWWQVDFGSSIGWVAQTDLIGGELPFDNQVHFPIILR